MKQPKYNKEYLLANYEGIDFCVKFVEKKQKSKVVIEVNEESAIVTFIELEDDCGFNGDLSEEITDELKEILNWYEKQEEEDGGEDEDDK